MRATPEQVAGAMKTFGPGNVISSEDWMESAQDGCFLAREVHALRIELGVKAVLCPGPKAILVVESEDDLDVFTHPNANACHDHRIMYGIEYRERMERLEAVAKWFCDRVDRGEVGSVKTYAAFKEALKETP